MFEYYELPLFPLRTVLFPGQTLPLHIFEPRYRQMMADCLEDDATFGIVLIREGAEVGGPATPYEVGTTAIIQDVERLPDGRMNIVTIGQDRFRLQEYDVGNKPYLMGRVSLWPWVDRTLSESSLSQAVRDRLERYVALLSQASDMDIHLDLSSHSPASLAVLTAVVLQISPEKKQGLLEIPSVGELLRQLDGLLQQESRVLQILLASAHLHSEMQSPFSQN